MLGAHFPKSVRVVDIGCGDGTFTLDLAEKFGPAFIRGIDPAANAIRVANGRISTRFAGSVSFEVGDIYTIRSKGDELAVARGVLHHLDRPQDAIAQLASQFRFVLALEPNGFNPAMKLIERTSAYHRQHDEKSYWPPSLNEWFRRAGLSVLHQKYFCLVPYFCPTAAAKALRAAEFAIESLPVAKQICCGTNLVLYGRAA
jgi:trans-aconitate methyltransferase